MGWNMQRGVAFLLAVGSTAVLVGCASTEGTSGGLTVPSLVPVATASHAGGSARATQARALASPTASQVPVITKRTVTASEAIPYSTKRVQDPTLAEGTTQVTTQGVPGTKTVTYEVTFTDGVQTSKKLIDEVVTTAPVTEVITVGTEAPATQPPATQQASNCDPNYAGACVPIASDVDCAGGSGNGPAYVQGPVTVVGQDIYGLDSDGDGIGCE